MNILKSRKKRNEHGHVIAEFIVAIALSVVVAGSAFSFVSLSINLKETNENSALQIPQLSHEDEAILETFKVKNIGNPDAVEVLKIDDSGDPVFMTMNEKFVVEFVDYKQLVK